MWFLPPIFFFYFSHRICTKLSIDILVWLLLKGNILFSTCYATQGWWKLLVKAYQNEETLSNSNVGDVTRDSQVMMLWLRLWHDILTLTFFEGKQLWLLSLMSAHLWSYLFSFSSDLLSRIDLDELMKKDEPPFTFPKTLEEFEYAFNECKYIFKSSKHKKPCALKKNPTKSHEVSE